MAFQRLSPRHSSYVSSDDRMDISDGVSFRTAYSVASLGAMTTPNDMIQIHFTTPTAVLLGGGQSYGTIEVVTVAGALLKITEGVTGGLASPTGTLVTHNRNRVLAATQTAPLVFYYDGTAATGGTELVNEYLGGGVFGTYVRKERWLFKPATTYAISVFSVSEVPATVIIHGSIHIPKV